MINYTWNCKVVDAYPQDGAYADVVYNVHWNLLAVSDQLNPEGEAYQSSSYGTQSLDVSDISDFIPFADLTEAQVQGWVESAMGEEAVASLKAGLDAQIEQEINPSSIQLVVGEPVPAE